MPLRQAGFVDIPPGNKPGFDHADVYRDSAGRSRLYLAHTGADRVDVIDCAAKAYLRGLPGHPGVAGILVDQGADLLFTSDRAAGRICVYRCSDERLLTRIVVGAHPNGLAFDAGRARLFCFNLGEPAGENCTASVADLRLWRVTATIQLPGRPRWAVYDAATDHVYVNIRRPAQVLAIDAGSLSIDRAIEVPASGPHGLCAVGERLFCAADDQVLAVLHRDTGAVEAALPLPGAPDVVMHDPALRRLYVAIGEPGVICVADTANFTIIETVPTERGAHTIGVDPYRHAIYAFLPASCRAAVYLDN